MKTKLFSYAHLEAARDIFPERVESREWLEELWSDEEINTCKQFEMNALIKAPSLATYPAWDFCQSVAQRPEEFWIVNELLASNNGLRTFLSIGCGLGEKELMFCGVAP